MANAKAAAKEKEQLDSYVSHHHVDEAVQDMVLALLEAKPDNPKAWLLERLEDELSELSDDLKESDVHRLFAMTRKITSEIVPQDTIDMIIQVTIELLGCDRVSLFVLEKKSEMLKLFASNLSTPIMVSPGQGIAGTVFQRKNTINIPDCYKDKRFDKSFDQKTGYLTKSLLAVPILDFDGQAIGVLQAINKMDTRKPPEAGKPTGTVAKPFTRNDEKIVAHLTQHVGIALRNADVYREAISTSERATGLLNTVQSLSQDLGTQSLILTITMHANKIVSAQRSTVFLVDEPKDQLWSVSTDTGVEIRIPKHAGIAGECCCEGKLINIPDAYADKRFNQAFDKKTGFKTHSILAIPLFDDPMSGHAAHARRSMRADGLTVIGVIQMINKVSYDGQLESFDEQDIEVMELFAKFVGPRIAGSAMLSNAKPGKEGSVDEAHLALGRPNEVMQEIGCDKECNARRRMSATHMDAMAEGEEEGEEEEEAD
mmetsp:Transcript_59891/g.106816  ORF Transcript_59891/g.106816 Transcript_59891/m.106816 type:complete len:485 (+) Transcript_59891:70-1524(+)